MQQHASLGGGIFSGHKHVDLELPPCDYSLALCRTSMAVETGIQVSYLCLVLYSELGMDVDWKAGDSLEWPH